MANDLRSDEDLIAAIERKDVSALETLYERHRVLTYSLALRIVANPSEAEDVLQDAFLNVWRAAATFRPGRSSGRSWLLSITHHRAIDKLRRRQSKPMGVPLNDNSLDVPDSADVWRDVAANLTGQAVRRALVELPADQRQAIELAYFKGFTQSKIADEMQVPLGTVKGRMRLGLRKLRVLLEETQTELGVE